MSSKDWRLWKKKAPLLIHYPKTPSLIRHSLHSKVKHRCRRYWSWVRCGMNLGNISYIQWLCNPFYKVLREKENLRYLEKAVRLQAQQFCAISGHGGKARCAAWKHPCDDQADSDSINHVTSQIFSKQQLLETHTAAKKKKEEKVHLKEKDFNVFNTHYCPHSASVRPPSSPICHSQRAYDAAIWKTEIIWGEGRRHSEGGWGWGVRTGGSERKREVDGLKKKCRVLSVDSSRILLNSQLPVFKRRLRRSSNLYSPRKKR